MKNPLTILFAAGAVLLGAAGCSSTQDQGPYLPEVSRKPPYESKEPIVLMDPGVQHSLTHSGLQEQVLPDGRLRVTVHFRNRENRRIEVQSNCVFKDQNGFSTGDETPWQTLILTENGTEDVTFVSANNQARKFTVRVRQAR